MNDLLQKIKYSFVGAAAAIALVGGIIYYRGNGSSDRELKKKADLQQESNYPPLSDSFSDKLNFTSAQNKHLESQMVAHNSQENSQLSGVKNGSTQITATDIPNTNYLDLNTITQIYQVGIDIASGEYKSLTLENRKQRRQLLHKDINQYVKLVIQYNDKVVKILQQAYLKVVENSNLCTSIFEESQRKLMASDEYNRVKIQILEHAARQKLKEKIEGRKQINVSEIKEIMQYQKKILQQNSQLFQNFLLDIRNSKQHYQIIPLVFSTIISDFVYEKYQIEEEDFIKNMSSIKTIQDQEIQDLFSQIEELMTNFICQAGYVQSTSDTQSNENK